MTVFLENESLLRMSFFLGIFFGVATLEALLPRRKLSQPRSRRWISHFALSASSRLLIKWFLPLTAIGAAALAQKNEWGLLSLFSMNDGVKVLITIVLLDLAIYTQHVVFHHVPFLWRLHRVHHADTDFDVTTGFRFHPLEIILSMLIKVAVIIVLGAPPVAVLIFEILLNATSMFNHGNIRLPQTLDKILRGFLVTPDMHRVHHSVIERETNSNFGFNLPWWDRLFKTYLAQPQSGQEKMTLGLKEFRDSRFSGFMELLKMPFHRQKDFRQSD